MAAARGSTSSKAHAGRFSIVKAPAPAAPARNVRREECVWSFILSSADKLPMGSTCFFRRDGPRFVYEASSSAGSGNG